MNKKDLEALVKECISEVVAEGYDEFQRADKGSKGVAAKNKAEEDTYGAGYAAGEKAAKSRYKKLAEAFTFLKKKVASKAPRYGDESPEETARMKAAVNQSLYGDESPEEVARMKANLEKLRRGEEIDEIYNRLKEDGFGLGPKGLDTNDDLDEANLGHNEISSIHREGRFWIATYKTVDGIQEKSFESEEDAKKFLNTLDEARFPKGADIGKPGKGFEKIAKAAEKKYGSKEAGQKVAGAILKKVLKK